jgi:hypothetical protein
MPLAIAARHGPASDDHGGIVEILALRLDQTDDGGRRVLGQLLEQARERRRAQVERVAARRRGFGQIALQKAFGQTEQHSALALGLPHHPRQPGERAWDVLAKLRRLGGSDAHGRE